MEIATFAEIEPEFQARVQKGVWCTLATVDRRGRPRSRIVHPIWEGSTCWLTTRRGSHKGRHLAANPYVSLTYYDIAKPAYADCRAEWVDDLDEKARLWTLISQTPPPMGFDPTPIYTAFDHPNFGLLRLTPWRIELATFPAPPQVWRGPG